jgi:pimeloyl-ACP methyl ester carboxylesterase
MHHPIRPRSTLTRRTRALAISAVVAALLLGTSAIADAAAPPKVPAALPTVVLVHGAWADSSSWSGVVGRLQRAGYTVDVPPNPLLGLSFDSDVLASYLRTVSGPIIVVGHSYGGAVITNAATGDAQVKALVYVDAYMPAQGETILRLTGAKPGSALTNVAATFNAVPFTGLSGPDDELYVKPSVFHADFAADLSTSDAAILASEQRPLAASVLQQPSGPPAWKSIRSYVLIGTADRVLPPAEQEAMAARAHATVVKVAGGSHLTLISHPGAVSRLIERAAHASQ